MSGTVEYVEVYPDGHEVVHDDFPMTELMSRHIWEDDELTYERVEDSIAMRTPLRFVLSGYRFAADPLHLESCMTYKGDIDVSIQDGAYYRLTKIVHHVEYPDPPTTGLWLDRENNVVWFDHPHEYYALLADCGCDYLNGLDYTPKPPFKPLITAMEIINKQEEA
ncbi:hypothetical protein [Bifidobacterium choerinum]|uniref:Uncharacterized protein n=1 Tax=Bifidobacterium choerinum TaxID=35760 RepID=A0A087AFA9_9BIFI|nr:hypothetical protein [Bifidobacterium choerinum]KFI57459.1 hypothetical protein BCHO_0878 [Bifidobacterium choerinum]